LISWGPWGLLLFAALDSIGIPMIGGVDFLLITFATVNPKQAILAAICAIVGSIAGSLVLFLIARKGGHVLLAQYTSHGSGLRLRNWFETYGLLTVFIPAVSPLPMPMKIPVFCAGALEVRTRSFFAVVAIARVIRYLALAYLGLHYGRYTIPFLQHHWRSVLLAVLVLCAVVIAVLRIINRGEPDIAPDDGVTDSE
jgi:membrane protein YqaA with SNARE-associated domain